MSAAGAVALLEEALRLVKEDVAGIDMPSNLVYRSAREQHLEKCLDRLDNLCNLAHELVREEYLRLRDHWPAL